jgi:hypothetical protein
MPKESLYSVCLFLDHCEQARTDALKWIKGTSREPLTERERQAYEAGHRQGCGDARRLFQLHASVRMKS